MTELRFETKMAVQIELSLQFCGGYRARTDDPQHAMLML